VEGSCDHSCEPWGYINAGNCLSSCTTGSSSRRPYIDGDGLVHIRLMGILWSCLLFCGWGTGKSRYLYRPRTGDSRQEVVARGMNKINHYNGTVTGHRLGVIGKLTSALSSWQTFRRVATRSISFCTVSVSEVHNVRTYILATCIHSSCTVSLCRCFRVESKRFWRWCKWKVKWKWKWIL
jgi:hypothetical protein